MKVYHIELLERCWKLTVSLFKSRLKTKGARRRSESAVLLKNEHAAQARARWHVRSGHAGLGRRTKNIGCS